MYEEEKKRHILDTKCNTKVSELCGFFFLRKCMMAWYLKKNQRILKNRFLFVLHYLSVQRKKCIESFHCEVAEILYIRKYERSEPQS